MEQKLKDLVLFTKDLDLIDFFKSVLEENNVFYYDYFKDFNTLDFLNKVVILDYDTDEDIDLKEFLLNLKKHIKDNAKIIVLSKDCERRNISDVARRGADRFVVKPLNRKRFKAVILPYLS
jgi:DNA-binding response OmpR family regulator